MTLPDPAANPVGSVTMPGSSSMWAWHRGPRRGQLLRLPVTAQDGYAYAIRPIHTHLDGDVVFALTTAPTPVPQTPGFLVRLGAIAADVMARAVCRGVHLAEDLGDHRSYRSLLAAPAPAASMVG